MAADMKHTGWEVVTCEDDGRLIVATPGDIVCHQDPNHEAGDETDVQRFRLIAAAPDLLAAVKDAHAMLSAVEVIDGEDGDPWSNALSRMSAVISNAEGR